MLAASSHVRLGILIATPDAMAKIPRSILSRAIRSHAYAHNREGEPFQTRHGWEGSVFYLRTSADRGKTAIWMEER